MRMRARPTVIAMADSNLQYARGRTRASKDIQQGDKTAISSCEDEPDFKQEDFATVLQDHFHCLYIAV